MALADKKVKKFTEISLVPVSNLAKISVMARSQLFLLNDIKIKAA